MGVLTNVYVISRLNSDIIMYGMLSIVYFVSELVFGPTMTASLGNIFMIVLCVCLEKKHIIIFVFLKNMLIFVVKLCHDIKNKTLNYVFENIMKKKHVINISILYIGFVVKFSVGLFE